MKRLEEMEAILFERMGGLPTLYIPSAVMEAGTAPNASPQALAAYNSYKKMVTNVRVDDQMGIILPSDVWNNAQTGAPSTQKMYEFKLTTPETAQRSTTVNETIERHKVEMLTTLLCDFITMGHEVRGTNNLGVIKLDLFMSSLEGFLHQIGEVLNRYALTRLWEINNLDPDLMPRFVPDMPQRLDLDGMGGFIKDLADAGMPLFPDEELQSYLRDAAGLPELTSPEAESRADEVHEAETAPPLLRVTH